MNAGMAEPSPVHRPWASFVSQDDGLVFAHTASCNLLFIPLPEVVGECAGVFLFGQHKGARSL
jgi:hypothetical protein